MAILGIENQTENWKTAEAFAPFFPDVDGSGDRRVRLVKQLLPAGATLPDPAEIEIELFWYGIQDALPDGERHHNAVRAKKWATLFENNFSSLNSDIKEWNQGQQNHERLTEPASNHYQTNDAKDREKLYNNLVKTEFDIVVKTPHYLFVGEAKHMSGLNANSKRVLVHQLIRQYVAAKLLLKAHGVESIGLNDAAKTGLRQAEALGIVPFVICHADELGVPKLKKTAQVKFMLKKRWLEEKNILIWDKIDEIAKG